MKKIREIIITENVDYDTNSRLVIPNSKKNELKNENEVIVDELSRIKLPLSIRKRMGIERNEKLSIYASGKNIILKKLEVKRNEVRENKIIIDNKYEVKILISSLKINTKVTTVDEIGNVLIWSEIRDKVGISKKDKLKICIKDDIIILIKKECEFYNKKKMANHNRR